MVLYNKLQKNYLCIKKFKVLKVNKKKLQILILLYVQIMKFVIIQLKINKIHFNNLLKKNKIY